MTSLAAAAAAAIVVVAAAAAAAAAAVASSSSRSSSYLLYYFHDQYDIFDSIFIIFSMTLLITNLCISDASYTNLLISWLN